MNLIRFLNFYPLFWLSGLYTLYFFIVPFFTLKNFIYNFKKDKFTLLLTVFFVYQLLSALLHALFSGWEAGDRHLAILANIFYFFVFVQVYVFIKQVGERELVSYLFAIRNVMVLYIVISITVFSISTQELSYKTFETVEFITFEYFWDMVIPRILVFGGGYANSSAVFIFTLFVCYFSLISKNEGRSVKIFLLYFVCLYLIFLSGSRIVFACMMCVFPFLFTNTRKGLFSVFIFFLVILFFAILINFEFVYGVVFEGRESSNDTRSGLYVNAFNMVMDKSPFLGIGYKVYLPGQSYPLGSHSSPVGYLFKHGIFGFLLYISIWICLIYSAIKNAYDFFAKSSVSFSALFLSVACNLFFVILCFEDLDGTPIFSLSLGLLLGLAHNKNFIKEFNVKV